MNLYVLEVVIWILGIRGHIPQNGNFGAGSEKSSLTGNASRMMRVLAAFIVAVLLLSLVLWVAVWLAIKLL
jgi:hypothetical protein